MDRIDFPFTNFGFPFRHRKWNRLRQVAQVTQPARCPRPETENCREENELPIPNKSCKNCEKKTNWRQGHVDVGRSPHPHLHGTSDYFPATYALCPTATG